MKWDYLIAYCSYEEKCKLCNKQNHWVLDIFDNKHHWLESGLKLLGEQEWELVNVQTTFRPYPSGASSGWYIFKKPKE